MKLLVLAPSFPDRQNRFYGGIFVKSQLEALSKYVEEINVVTPIPISFGKLYEDKLCKNYSFDNVNVYFPRFLHLPLNYFRRRRGEREARVVYNLIEEKGIEFDLIHAHFTWPCGYVGVKLAKKFDVPSIVTIHEDRDWFLREYHSQNEYIYFTWRHANALIRVNRIDVPKLKEFNKNVISIPNGYDPELFYPVNKEMARKELGIPYSDKVVFSFSNLVERKGYQYLIEAMKKVSEKRGDVVCYIGGTGPYKKKIERKITELGLKNRVKLIGFVPAHRLSYWISAADIFVLPSLSESFGIVQIEAMACGVPVVATRNGGSEEIITSEDYGLLCEPANPDDLAKKILIALEKEWDREKIRKYAERYTWENIAGETLDIYRKLMEGL